MIKLGSKIRQTDGEKADLAGFTGISCNPETVDDYNAWLDHAKLGMDINEPEERLFCALMDELKV